MAPAGAGHAHPDQERGELGDDTGEEYDNHIRLQLVYDDNEGDNEEGIATTPAVVAGNDRPT